MREILFRGKRSDNGNWICGSLYTRINEAYIIPLPIITSKSKVDPDTVGQFTGLTDKNGKKIFEGDIVQYYGTYALEVFIEKGHTKIRWFDTVTNSVCKDMFFGYDPDAYGECEVIGNIHDNPELLEVQHGNQ